MNLLVYLLVFGIYLLNYFNATYIRTCMYSILISLGFDLLWLIV